MNKLIGMIVAAVLGVGVAMAGDIRQLPTESMGFYGATHSIELNAGDTFSAMTNGGTFTATYGVPAGTWIQFVAMELKAPFVSGLVTNNILGDATLAFGTEDSSAAFMAAKQISTNTAVTYFQALPAVLTPVDVDTNTATACAVSFGTTYSATTNLLVTITPAAGQNLKNAARGRVVLYLKKH